MPTLDRYGAVLEVLRGERWSSERSRSPRFRRAAAAQGIGLEGMQSLLVLDPPAHTRIRKLVNRDFTSRRVAELEPAIQELTDGLLDAATACEDFDLAEVLAKPLPALVIARLLGVPAEDRPRFHAWSNDLVGPLIERPDSAARLRHERAQEALGAFLLDLVAERRRSPRDDLVSALVARREEDALDDAELLALCRLLLVAGHETTTNLIAAGLGLLLSDGEAWDRTTRDDVDLDLLVEELARLVCPIRAVARVALGDVPIGARTVRRGEIVTLSLARANRDPEVFEHPDVLVVDRDPNPHLAFGNGIHFCLGAALARLETRVALRSVARRLPDLRLADTELRWRDSPLVSGVTELPVRTRPRTAGALQIRRADAWHSWASPPGRGHGVHTASLVGTPRALWHGACSRPEWGQETRRCDRRVRSQRSHGGEPSASSDWRRRRWRHWRMQRRAANRRAHPADRCWSSPPPVPLRPPKGAIASTPGRACA